MNLLSIQQFKEIGDPFFDESEINGNIVTFYKKNYTVTDDDDSNTSHDIYECYTKIQLNVDSEQKIEAITNIYFRRAKLDIIEFIMNMAHPHVSNARGWSNICFGGTILAEHVSDLRSGVNINEETIYEMFYLLDQLYHTQSSEGGPYHYINEYYENQDYGDSYVEDFFNEGSDESPHYTELIGEFFDSNGSMGNDLYVNRELTRTEHMEMSHYFLHSDRNPAVFYKTFLRFSARAFETTPIYSIFPEDLNRYTNSIGTYIRSNDGKRAMLSFVSLFKRRMGEICTTDEISQVNVDEFFKILRFGEYLKAELSDDDGGDYTLHLSSDGWIRRETPDVTTISLYSDGIESLNSFLSSNFSFNGRDIAVEIPGYSSKDYDRTREVTLHDYSISKYPTKMNYYIGALRSIIFGSVSNAYQAYMRDYFLASHEHCSLPSMIKPKEKPKKVKTKTSEIIFDDIEMLDSEDQPVSTTDQDVEMTNAIREAESHSADNNADHVFLSQTTFRDLDVIYRTLEEQIYGNSITTVGFRTHQLQQLANEVGAIPSPRQIADVIRGNARQQERHQNAFDSANQQQSRTPNADAFTRVYMGHAGDRVEMEWPDSEPETNVTGQDNPMRNERNNTNNENHPF